MSRICRLFQAAAFMGCTLMLCRAVIASELSFDELEKQFRELPAQARQLTGPLFWLHGDESKERLETYVGKVAEGGNGCFTAESRPHKDWLGEGWWRDLAICLEAAKKHGLHMWIFDEKMWPSQAIGGKVPPRYAAKRLEASAAEVEGPQLFEADGYGGDHYVATVAGRLNTDGKIEGDTLLDLEPSIRDGTLHWQAPAGHWRIIKFTHTPAPGLLQVGGSQLSVDGASKDCVDWFLQQVYQPHYDRFGTDFGTTIRGYFYDEPEVAGDWGKELNKVLTERGVDWKKPYVAHKFELAGEEQAAAKYQYRDALAEAWGRTMYGGMSEWCRERKVKSIGHFMEHSNLYVHHEFCGGDMMRLQKYSDMGGIDAVFDQFVMGKREARDAPCWQTPKLGSSITHAYGKPDDLAMVEIFGARGQDLTYPEMKWWTDHMHVSGINFLIPHSFNPRAPRDTDCPPYFYNGGFEPRWPLYRVFADYTSRLSVMLTGGRHVCPVALLFLGQSAQVGRHVLPDQISEALQDALYDCDWLPYEVFEDAAKLDGGNIRLREESYRVLVVPPVEVIPYATLAKAKDFFDRGGVVVGHGFLPTWSATLGKTSADIARLREAIWGQAKPGLAACKVGNGGGRSYLLPEQPTPEQLQQVLAEDAGVRPTLEVIEGRTDHWLHVLHRVKADRDVFFITNQNHEGDARRFRLAVTAEGQPECWDAMRNEITAIPYTRHGKQVELSLRLEPLESVLLVFQPSSRPLPTRMEPGNAEGFASIPLVRDATPPPPEPQLEVDTGPVQHLMNCAWVWYPEGDPVSSAPPGTCHFRKQFTVPADRRIKSAIFTGTADNGFTLYVNGQDAGRGDDSAEGWRNPVQLDVRGRLQAGVNQLAIAATNAGTHPSPAGLIGQLLVTFEQGDPLTVRVDDTWNASKEASAGWLESSFDDGAWADAKRVARFGDRPWGHLSGQLTLSPVKADPFLGRCEIPAGLDLAGSRIYLEMDAVSPEAAARVTVNGRDAGGFIGKPLRLHVTPLLKPGPNTVRIEPFAPVNPRLSYRR